ncbi:hypothetical protein EDF58_10839 [Novosphingobium sp. PhB57]|jgi:hypothetical protein|nr:hypothetical protein EDF58_10839 [Novosphingobium sp. PhB57]
MGLTPMITAFAKLVRSRMRNAAWWDEAAVSHHPS